MSDNSNADSAPQGDVVLSGLDGTNPLGFLAALGAFRLLARTNPTLKMLWIRSDGTWRPALRGSGLTVDQLGDKLFASLTSLDKSVWSLDKKLPFAGNRLRSEAALATAAASIGEREKADGLAAIGVECYRDDKGDFEDTALRMVRAGDSTGQGLLAYGKRIIESTTAQELQNTVTSIWQHQDKQCALRWDPTEDKGYALQWRDPGEVGARSVRGGNCLALVAMALFPAIPDSGEVETVGFGLRKHKQISFTWAIWTIPICIDTTKSLLSMQLLQRPQPDRTQLLLRGIEAAYRSDRVMTSTYYANFTPAQRVS